MNSLRNERFLARRSRKANIPARSSVSLAERSKRWRPPTNPSTARNNRFFALLRAAPFLARIVDSRFLARVRSRTERERNQVAATTSRSLPPRGGGLGWVGQRGAPASSDLPQVLGAAPPGSVPDSNFA